MNIVCPYGFEKVDDINSSFSVDNRTVSIYDNLCNSPDLCGITNCEFHDDSKEATKRFTEALYFSKTLEGFINERELTQLWLDCNKNAKEFINLVNQKEPIIVSKNLH